jgi:hypothetical protein
MGKNFTALLEARRKIRELEETNRQLEARLIELEAFETEEKSSPRNIIPLERVQDNKAELVELLGLPDDTRISIVIDTNSMDPWFDVGCELFLVPLPKDDAPFRYEDLAVGDVAAYENDGRLTIHQITEISEDEQGKYYRFKGINVSFTDPYIIRDYHIKYLLVTIFN